MKVLAFTLPAAGHQNAVIGLCQALQERNHQIYFIIETGFTGKLKKFGFEEIVLESTAKNGENQDKSQNPIKYFAEMMKELGFLSNKSPLEKMQQSFKNKKMTDEAMKNAIEDEPRVRKVIEQVQPDLILVDHMMYLPCFLYGKIPWVYVWSAAPLMMFETKKLPPPMSGKKIAL